MDTILARAADKGNYTFYYYSPSVPAAIVFAVLFFLATAAHSFQTIRSRTWFMIPFLVGGIFETAGYAFRAISAAQSPGPYTLPPYIVQAVLILVAPALFAASIYMQLGRIVRMVDAEKLLFIRRTWLTKIFVSGDVVTFLLQSSGASFQATAKNHAMGKIMVLVGLWAQVAFLALFVAAAGVFHFRLARQPTALSAQRPWQKHMLGLYIVGGLIFVRSIVRCVEYMQGDAGFVMAHEVFLYVFDAVMMLAAMGCMNWFHPGEVAGYVKVLNREQKEEADSSDGEWV